MKTNSLPFARSQSVRAAALALSFSASLGLGLGLVEGDARAEGDKPAAAASDDFKPHYSRGVGYYKSGQYEKAVEEFQAAYMLKPAPLLLFNLAQAHRQAGHNKQALDLYERYLNENPSSDLRPETEKYIAELKTALEAEEKVAAEKAAAEKAAAEKAAADKIAAEKAAADRAALEYTRRPSRPLNIAKWTLGGAGLALTIAGAVLMGLDGRPTCDLASGQRLCPEELNTLELGGGLLGAGLASIGGSVALFAVDYKQTHSGAKQAMLIFRTRF